ncbi:hypothetical protein DFO67_104357 [Modicisalibacter xianhensis]|uniref:Uncharacterized protein n=1 Tax=Modicisalibacter xianhensis TaxID=442341 RepID=A0A4R8FW45_9GAMM|nr:hypothetical protein [Halomonas xianhensis]TDX31092.1 hypothetical protein DFO67_104357 [Halomonas xianhensis]
MKSITLLFILFAGTAFGIFSLNTQESFDAKEWSLQSQLRQESSQEREGWGGPG